MDSLEPEVEAAPSKYAYRSDAINIYVLGTTACSGRCAFPGSDDVIVVGQGLRSTTILHEIGRYFGLFHTQGSICGSCDSESTGVCHTKPGDDEIADTLPDLSCWQKDDITDWTFNQPYSDLAQEHKDEVDGTFKNIMSYHSIRNTLTPEQVDRWIEAAQLDRSHVLVTEECFLPEAGDEVTFPTAGLPVTGSWRVVGCRPFWVLFTWSMSIAPWGTSGFVTRGSTTCVTWMTF